MLAMELGLIAGSADHHSHQKVIIFGASYTDSRLSYADALVLFRPWVPKSA
jgi:hypothetical protein